MSDTRRGQRLVPERGIYPGLVRPYADEADYVNQPKFVNNKTFNTSRSIHSQCSENDPFSIYDDESAHDHYFFLPAGKVDLTNFKPSQRVPGAQRERCGTWSRTKPPDHEERVKLKSANSDTSSHCQCVSAQTVNKRHSRNCRGVRKLDNSNSNSNMNSSSSNNNRTSSKNTVAKDLSSGGDYCSLSLDSVSPHYPNPGIVCAGRNTPLDQDSFREFALSLVRTTANNSAERNENSNDYYDPSQINKTNSKCESKSRDRKCSDKLDLDKCIDHCTCMICVKAGRYHWAGGDTDAFIEEPCNCIGGRKNIVRRWLCMGVIALFLPCLICYLPAKLCQSSCTSTNCPQTKLKDKQCLVRYVSERNIKNQDEGLL